MQYVYGASLFGGPVVLTGVQLRADGGAALGGKLVDCEMLMSTAPAPLVAMSSQFALNRGADDFTEVVVFRKGYANWRRGGVAGAKGIITQL